MRILVTGVAGLIGSHLADELIKRGYSVVGIDNLSFGNINNLNDVIESPNFTFIQSDLQNLNSKQIGESDIVFHLASLKKSPVDEISSSDILQTNIEMSNWITEYCMRHNSHLVFASTSDVYGNSKTFSEDEPVLIGPTTAPRASYAVSKIYCEQLFLMSPFDVTVFRIFGCFSERSSRIWSGGHVPVFLNAALRGEDIIIHGNGLQTRSMCHVSDIIDGMSSIFNKELAGEIINLGSCEEISVLDCAKKILTLTKSNSKIVFKEPLSVFGPHYREIKRRVANISKAERLFDFKVKYSFDEALEMVHKHGSKTNRLHCLNYSLGGVYFCVSK